MIRKGGVEVMCDWCLEHGGGKEWYLNTKNYLGEKLLKENGEVRRAADMFFNETKRLFSLEMQRWGPHLGKPVIGKIVRRMAENLLKKRERGQVIPLEEAKLILNNLRSVAVVQCVCRKVSLGISEERCLLFSPLADYMRDRWPSFAEGRISHLSQEEAKEFLEKSSQEGCIQAVFGYPVPFVGNICNCRYPSCFAFKGTVFYGFKDALRKSEYMMTSKEDLCNGCGKCLSRCQFGAISILRGKVSIAIRKCFGCGSCALVCEQKALELIPRIQNLPEDNGRKTLIQSRVESVNIDVIRCKSLNCGECLRICPKAAFRVYQSKILCLPFECNGCGECKTKCPTGAIEIFAKRR